MAVIKFKKLTNTATVPTKAHAEDACHDLYADEPDGVVIPPHQTVKIHTGIAMEIPTGYWGAILARSGISTNRGLRPGNCIGCVDNIFRGEVMVALHNDTGMEQKIEHGERIAQFCLMPQYYTEFIEVDELNYTDRKDGSFGSSGRF